MDTTYQPHKIFVYQKPELIADIKKMAYLRVDLKNLNMFNTHKKYTFGKIN
jgi:hypothetical protein